MIYNHYTLFKTIKIVKQKNDSFFFFIQIPDTCINKNELKCLNEGYLGPGKAENEYRCSCICPPTHRGERCEEQISADYYEAMNVTQFCGGKIDKSDQIIEQSVNSTPCAWSIKAPEKQSIQIEFEHFSLRSRFKSKLNHSQVDNRCLFESLELRTEDHYNGQHFCGDDIKAGQKFESKQNIMILIVHTYSRLRTASDGFRAKITFVEQQQNSTNKLITTKPDSNHSQANETGQTANTTGSTRPDIKSTTELNS